MSTPADPPSAFAATVASPLPDPSLPSEVGEHDSATAAVDVDLDVDGAADASALPTLSHVGRYALKRPLGSGGLGTVFEAWDPLLSRAVALKTLHYEADAGARAALDELFLNEARAVARLNHPHIVTVYDAGLSAQGVYIAMARLRGRDLRHALAAGWRPRPAAAAQLTRRVAEALAYAHEHGVIHCDIKPANIFVSNRGRPTVLDFGIARVAHGAAVAALDGMVAGSPHYLAPEQLVGGPIDGRTDVYALGVVLYEMLAGQHAFDGASVDLITDAVLHHAPPPAHEVRATVPRGLSEIAARAMAREPAARYASAREMAQALRDWVAHAGPPAAPVTARPRTPRAALGGAAGALAAIVIAAWAWQEPTTPTLSTPPTPTVTSLPPAAADAPVPGPAPQAPSDLSPGATPAVIQASAKPRSRPAPPAARPQPAAPPAPAAGTHAAPAPALGQLLLAVSPWGRIEVDGRSAGITPPLSKLELPVGRHRIVVHNGEHAPHAVQVEVSADKPVVVRHRFGP